MKKSTTGAKEILRLRIYHGKPHRIAQREQTHREMALGDKLRRYREQAGLTQEQLARQIGTGPSAISRIEDADYDSHTMETLRRVADALDMRLIIDFEPKRRLSNRKQA